MAAERAGCARGIGACAQVHTDLVLVSAFWIFGSDRLLLEFLGDGRFLDERNESLVIVRSETYHSSLSSSGQAVCG